MIGAARRFASELGRLSGRPVHFQDERLSTYAASDVDLAKLDEHRLATRAKAEDCLGDAFDGRPFKRFLISRSLSLARRSIRYRESSRLDRARAFGLVRAIFRTLGPA